MITLHKRINIETADFGPSPTRVATITTAIDQERAVRRSAPAGSYDADIAGRNIDDLQTALGRAEVNEAARTAHLARLDAERQAKADEADARASAAITDQLRSNYLAQPGTSESEFEKVLPRLLERQREDAALNAPAVREQQLAEQRRRLGPAF